MIDAETSLILDGGRVAALKVEQDIPDSFLASLNDRREQKPKGTEFRHVASIPTAVVELWKRQGFDIHKASAREIVARLRNDDLNAFIIHAGA